MVIRMLLLLPLLAACSEQPDVPHPEGGLLLARRPEALVNLDLPETSHPGGERAPDRTVLRGSFHRGGRHPEFREYTVALPMRRISRSSSNRAAPTGMSLLDAEGREVPFQDRKNNARALGWRCEDDRLVLRVARGQPPPRAEDYTLVYRAAATWENELDPATSTLEGRDFALRAVHLGEESRHGLLLPAPGEATWELTLPNGAVLDLEAQVLPRGVDRGIASDGARLVVEVEHGRDTTLVLDLDLVEDSWQPARADLSPWGGERMRLRVRTLPGDDATLDRVFVATPHVHVPQPEPTRVVLVFIDTLRRDHLGLYGYERDTTPNIDAWARDAVVFDDARSNAPWTLPSVRALLSGRPASAWDGTSALQSRLTGEGFVTGAMIANAILSRNFGMDQGWGEYRYDQKAPADLQVDRALDFLRRHPDRDLLLMMQFMDPHMPYGEPEPWHSRWVGPTPPAMSGGTDVVRGKKLEPEQQAAVGRYLTDRYDQSIAYADHELGRLLVALGKDDVVVLFADHGEEFYDHGGLAHGHTLHEELLRVPLVLKAPGLAPGRVAEPVSLLDVSPTLLELLGLEPTVGAHGRTLSPWREANAQPDGPSTSARCTSATCSAGMTPGACSPPKATSGGPLVVPRCSTTSMPIPARQRISRPQPRPSRPSPPIRRCWKNRWGKRSGPSGASASAAGASCSEASLAALSWPTPTASPRHGTPAAPWAVWPPCASRTGRWWWRPRGASTSRGRSSCSPQARSRMSPG